MNGTLSIAIVSGKGGVGKTNLALNLAYALCRAKQKVLLMDCDLGLANLDVLLGIAPKKSVEQVMAGEADFDDAVITLEPGGFSLLPASSGITLSEEDVPPAQLDFLRRLNAYAAEYEYLLLDVGAGISDSVRNFAAKAAMRIVVVTPEPTSLTDAYALIKVLATRHGLTDFHVLANQVTTPAEEKATYSRLAGACKKFLDIDLNSLGAIRYDAEMIRAVHRQEPLLKFSPGSPAGKDLIAAAARIHKRKENMPVTPLMPLPLAESSRA